jgi:hypothetical protein
VLLDHHVEELLAALNELGRRYGWCSAKRQTAPAGYTQLRSDVRAEPPKQAAEFRSLREKRDSRRRSLRRFAVRAGRRSE